VEIIQGLHRARAFFLDHGAGVVIGETAIVGDYCVMFHNVTLAARESTTVSGTRWSAITCSFGTNAILLGPIRIGDHAKVGANAFVINHDVPAHSTVVGTTGEDREARRQAGRSGPPADGPAIWSRAGRARKAPASGRSRSTYRPALSRSAN